MVGALGGRDGDTSRRVIGMDHRYKERGAEIDEECMLLQARQAPVAGDLRLTYAIQAVTNHLVRSGTLCEHVCRSVAETAGAVERDREVEVALYEMARAALVVHYLERIADHGVEISRHTLFIVTGEHIRSATRPGIESGTRTSKDRVPTSRVPDELSTGLN